MTHWWAGDEKEIYWLETTDRTDIGVDLKAPQTKDDGSDYWGYSLVKEVAEGDLVFHYDRPRRAIVSCSRAVGDWWSESLSWAAHGTVARNAGVIPYRRPGWRRGLVGLHHLEKPVTLDDIRANEDAVKAVASTLIAEHGSPIYFPFEVSEKRPPRPLQAYMTKLPVSFVELFPSLQAAARLELASTPFVERHVR